MFLRVYEQRGWRPGIAGRNDWEQYEEGGCAMTVWTIAVTVRDNYEKHWGAMAVTELSEERGGALTACE